MNRIGFHYFPDTNHYREHDLNFWLPRLQELGTCWLVLRAPLTHAIPENFIQGLISAGIQPLLHLHLRPGSFPRTDDLSLLLRTYQRWGVRYITLFDQPNLHYVWRTTAWVQSDLVERFLDLYIPLAHTCLNAGLTPIFPPLKPGGDYWDTAFLRASLESIRRRGHRDLLNHLVLGAYAFSGDRPLQWGAGGPERWPNTRPYYTPPGVEDQRGFRIFDWYNAISQAALSTPRPIFLFGMGYPSEVDEYIKKNLQIVRLMTGERIQGLENIPANVIGGAFDPLVDLKSGGKLIQGWYSAAGEPHAQTEVLKQWIGQKSDPMDESSPNFHPINHYLLLPSYEWGITDYHLDLIRPIVKKYQPTIGFSLEEAQSAQRVTVIGGEEIFSDESLGRLRAAGVQVERVQENGTNIASLISSN
jgi:hypothetical protein